MLYKQRYINTNKIFVKNFLYFLTYFFTLVFLLGCNSKFTTKQASKNIDCPSIFFSSEHRNYIHSNEKVISLDNLAFKANINNFKFNMSCKKSNNFELYPLDILFIIEPLTAKQLNIKLPIYTTLLDQKNNLIDTQYFSIQTEIINNQESKKYSIIEHISRLNIATNKDNVSSIIIGFMLDNEKKDLLN